MSTKVNNVQDLDVYLNEAGPALQFAMTSGAVSKPVNIKVLLEGISGYLNNTVTEQNIIYKNHKYHIPNVSGLRHAVKKLKK